MGTWQVADDLGEVSDLCISFNRGRLYETFWQYTLSADELSKQNAKAWLYVEKGKTSGVALSRKIGNVTTIEELWGEIDGYYGDPQGKLSSKDSEKLKECSTIFDSLERPARLRVPLDNHFGGGVAIEFGLKWLNGMALATRELNGYLKFEIPDGVSIRPAQKGDEEDIKSMHDIHYRSFNDLKVYSDWVGKWSSETYIAEVDGKFAGHIIAEVRPKGLGDFDIAVSPEFFRHRIGSTLLLTGLNSLFRRGAKVAIADFMIMNAATNNFYHDNGFNLSRAYNYFSI